MSEGRYGCVYDPPLPCKPKTQKVLKYTKGKAVGKLTKADEALQSFDASIILRNAPNVYKYFILVDSICKPENGPEKQQCEPVANEADENIAQIVMPYGGITLNDLVLKKKQQVIANFMPYMEHILEAGVFLLMKQLVHFDLHRGNFVVQEKPRIIDLGFIWSPISLTNVTVQNQYRRYNPRIDQESPEASYMNGRLKPFEIKKDLLLEDIIKRKPVFKIVNALFGITLDSQETMFEKFLTTSQAILKDDFLTIYKTYWSKFDAWGFGTILANILYDCMFDSYFANTIYKPNKNKIDTVIKGLLHPDPGFRLDAVEAIQLWNPKSVVLNEPSVASWISQQSAYRSALSASAV